MSLFIKEAVFRLSKRFTGAITFVQKLSIKLAVLISISIVTIAAFIFSAEYSRKENVRDFLMLNKGVIESFAITASNSVAVTGIQVVEGEILSQSKAQSKPLLNILPEGSELSAELLLPTRSAGFVQLGNNTRLRFDAFPYQRFGFIKSETTRIDQILISPNEIQLLISLQEPYYRLQEKLNQQQMQELYLKSGMLFEAGIMLEQRTLLEPVYNLKGRLS